MKQKGAITHRQRLLEKKGWTFTRVISTGTVIATLNHRTVKGKTVSGIYKKIYQLI